MEGGGAALDPEAMEPNGLQGVSVIVLHWFDGMMLKTSVPQGFLQCRLLT